MILNELKIRTGKSIGELIDEGAKLLKEKYSEFFREQGGKEGK